MGQPVEWSRDLETGIAEIDREHRLIFAQVARLSAAMGGLEREQEVAAMLDFLSKYVVNHFEMEESWMTRKGYPAAEEHRAEHVAFLSALQRLRVAIQANPASPALAEAVHECVTVWLREHIGATDLAFARWLFEDTRDQMAGKG